MHPYTYPALPSDPLTRNWNSFYRMRPMHDTMVANGDSTKSIWATEFGAPTGTGLDAVTESMQAEILRDGFNEARSLGFVQKVFVYSLQDRGSDPGDRRTKLWPSESRLRTEARNGRVARCKRNWRMPLNY